ncbi:MmcQ/YjbR family DNA-binding protein [Devosia rhizoryzae]|uniref:MmcQ/YjbR family DNA-binding protein n=1 Tax=Devosia rhizoryzae TaxID=2774137 RepID=A0ABX7C8R2_9HYPH|nr:MmcQ/YjbR family DNA-binding protein [Devosia rhizoryzae]QQR40491.1 MmcQ/YjbR family DNA-binding protein [Devosia rhizoryzae]
MADQHFARIARLVEARGLREVEQSTSYNTPALKVAGNAFVRMLDDTTAVLQCPVDQKVLLMEISPEIFFETDHYVGHDAVLVRLDQISDEELALKLEDAWTFKAPERLRK